MLFYLVNLEQCGMKTFLATTSDPDFTTLVDGTVLASRFTVVPLKGRTFTIEVLDGAGMKRVVEVMLTHRAQKAGGIARRCFLGTETLYTGF